MRHSIESMCAAEAQFFRGEPVQHIVVYEERKLCEHRRSWMRKVEAEASRRNPRVARACY